MDAYEELLVLARGTARTLLAQGVAPLSFRDDEGAAVDGWVVDRLPAWDRGGAAVRTRRTEVRSSCALVLDVDGRFHRYRDSSLRMPAAAAGRWSPVGWSCRRASARTLVALGPGALRPGDGAAGAVAVDGRAAPARRPAAAGGRTPAARSGAAVLGPAARVGTGRRRPGGRASAGRCGHRAAARPRRRLRQRDRGHAGLHRAVG
ncbi:hypothetical protein ACFQ1I_41580 [Kitasatospora arboriphila]